jgi:hypothetical protein
MLGTFVRCSVAAVASVALLVAFVSTPEGFTQPRKPGQKRRGRDLSEDISNNDQPTQT